MRFTRLLYPRCVVASLEKALYDIISPWWLRTSSKKSMKQPENSERVNS